MNAEIKMAWQLVQNTGCNVFLTGKAGTGKTTFLRELVGQTHKRNVVLAPTGIAAINAQGSTIHSFFQLPLAPYIPGTQPRPDDRAYKFSERKRRLIRTLDLIIIDEISMVRPDVLDSVDAVMRRYRDRTKPFGGVQLLLIGDLQQLAPVAKQEEWQLLQPYYATPYFFSSLALREAGFVTIELSTIYRQTDQHFIDLLNKIRNNQADVETLREINSRYRPGFSPANDEGYIRLTTHNWQADQVNKRALDALDTPAHVYEAEVWKDFPEMSFPTAQSLELKVGAQVMFVKNDSSPAKRYYNGMIGQVVSLGSSFVRVLPQGTAKPFDVTEEQWENTRYKLNETTREIEEELLGTFKQMPLKTAWAITVHKSQGLTFDRAIIDVQHSFSHGQTYVALSRCKSLEGIVLSAPIPPQAIISDQSVLSFIHSIPDQIPSPEQVKEMERSYFVSLVAELFTFHQLRGALDAYIRHIDEYLSRQQPDDVAKWKTIRINYQQQVEQVSLSFAQQYQRIINADNDYADNALLQERCKKGARWFADQITPLLQELAAARFRSGNNMVNERLTALTQDLKEQLRQKILLLSYVEEHGFSVKDYLRERDFVALPPKSQQKKPSSSHARNANGKRGHVSAQKVYEDILEEANSYVYEDIEEPDLPPEIAAILQNDLPY